MSLIAASLLMLAAETGQHTLDYWMVYDGRDIDRESILFVEKSALVQRPDGWINFLFHEVRNGSRLKTVKSRVMGTWVNCKTREYINDYRTEYGRDGAMLQQGKLDEQRRIPAPGSAEEKVLAFACGDTRGAMQLAQGAHIVAYADALYAQGHPQVAKASATPAAPPGPAPAANADRPADYWLIDDGANAGYERIAFVDKSSVSRRVDGRTGFLYVGVLNGSQQKELDAKSLIFGAVVNCQTREFANEDVSAFGGTAGMEYGAFEEPPAVVARGSAAEKLLTFVCGNTAGAKQLPRGADLDAYADNIYARGRQSIATAPVPRATAAAPAPQAAPTLARPAVAAPGLGRANWIIISDDEDSMLIYAPATVRRGQDSGKAWFTRIFAQPQTIDGKSGVVTLQFLQAANCKHDSLGLLQASAYGADGRVVFASVFDNPAYTHTEDGSPRRTRVDIICGRPTKLPGLSSFNFDVAGMRKVYQSLREMNDQMSDIIDGP
jgi:hypothetical protein